MNIHLWALAAVKSLPASSAAFTATAQLFSGFNKLNVASAR